MESLLKILRDSIWQFAGVIVAIILFVLAWFWQHDTKNLSYETILNSSLIDVSDEAASLGEIKVELNGEPVTGLRLYVFRIENSGDIPIKAEDYAVPLAIQFHENVKVVSLNITDARSEVLKADLLDNFIYPDAEVNTLELPSVLLNEGDYYALKIITEQSNSSEPQIAGRLVGIEKITDKTTKRDFKAFFSGGIFGFILSLVAGFLINLVTGRIEKFLSLLGTNQKNEPDGNEKTSTGH